MVTERERGKTGRRSYLISYMTSHAGCASRHRGIFMKFTLRPKMIRTVAWLINTRPQALERFAVAASRFVKHPLISSLETLKPSFFFF